ncbi:MAG TPA: hypothetical protein VH988_19615 [Thermoanaerobaculia bacterium]|jgi:hypothetical protein|nr:hypothetical protein [Thermoanaerobaculia bacterium]
MNAKLTSLVILLAAASVNAQPAKTPLKPATITFKCHNPPIPLKFDYNQLTSGGKGQASSQKVQFNVNKAAVQGTIFVDEKNNGICTATITSNHKVTRGWAVFDPEGSFTDGSGKPSDINSSVDVSESIVSNKEIVFSVFRKGNLSGNVTMTFFVEYERAR